jgi:hypothetical protein
MQDTSTADPVISEPLTWAEICERYPEQWVALVEIDRIEPGLGANHDLWPVLMRFRGSVRDVDEVGPHLDDDTYSNFPASRNRTVAPRIRCCA